MRKSFNGLAGIVRGRLGNDPMCGDLFLFCNRNRNRLKALVCEESGVWVLAKRLDRGTFAWPSVTEDRVKIKYREAELALLLSGFDSKGLKSRSWRRRTRQFA